MTSSMKQRIAQIRHGQVPKGSKMTHLGIVPSDWDIVPIGDIGRIVTGSTPPTVIHDYYVGDRLFITPADFTEGIYVDNTSRTVSDSAYGVSRVIPPDSIYVVCIGATVGKINMCRVAAICNQQINAIVPGNGFCNQFLYYCIDYFFNRTKARYVGSQTLPIVSKNLFSRVGLVLPPLVEQRKIAKILATQDRVIELKKKLLEETKKRKKALLKMLMNPTETKRLEAASPHGEAVSCRFGDNNKLVFMGDIGFAYTGIIGKGKEDFGKGDAWYIPFLNVLKNTKIDLGNLVRVNVSKSEKQNVVQKGDLFFNISSETPDEVGLCAFLANKAERTYLNSFCLGFRLKPDAKIEPHYLAEWFNSCYGRRIMRSLAQGVTRYNLSREGLLSTPINLPPLPIQRCIAAILSAADREIDLLRQDLEQEKQKKKALMQLLLTGIVRV